MTEFCGFPGMGLSTLPIARNPQNLHDPTNRESAHERPSIPTNAVGLPVPLDRTPVVPALGASARRIDMHAMCRDGPHAIRRSADALPMSRESA
jgi:hypothetical protein